MRVRKRERERECVRELIDTEWRRRRSIGGGIKMVEKVVYEGELLYND